jgi:hypothetical protein
MLADGFLNPIDTARASLQNQIGYFLQGRARLTRLMSNQNLQIQGEARGLYSVQTTLEDQFQNQITPLLSKIQAGTWDSSDILTLGGFTMQITNQIGSVNSLEQKAGGPGVGTVFDMDTIGVIGAGALIILGLGLMGGVFFGGRSTGSNS